jgi:hypothetical protein
MMLWWCYTGKLALKNAGKFLAESPSLTLPALASGAAKPVHGHYGVISFISMCTAQHNYVDRLLGALSLRQPCLKLTLPGAGNFTAYPPVSQAECSPGLGKQK